MTSPSNAFQNPPRLAAWHRISCAPVLAYLKYAALRCAKNATMRLSLAGFERRYPSSRESGFTLIEMLVVIAIMGLVLAMVTSFRQPRSQRLQNQTAARQVAEALRDAHGQAIAEGHPVSPQLPHLPASITVSVQAPPGGIVFAPDGSASGGEILLGTGGSEIAVSVDWLTGRVASNAP